MTLLRIVMPVYLFDLSMAFSEKPVSTFPDHAPVEFSGPTLTPGPRHRERYQGPARAHRSNMPSVKQHPADALQHDRRSLRRPPAAIFLGQNGPDQAAEALGFLVMQIAGQAEGMTAGTDELLQRVGALGGIADDGDAGARTA